MRSRFLFPLCAALLFVAGGCTSTRTIVIETQADPGYPFASPAEMVVALGAVAPAANPEDRPNVGQAAFRAEDLTLEQRIVRADVEAGLRAHGFSIVADPQDAAMVLYFTETYRDRSYDSYERIPVSSSTFGFGWGRGYSRDFYSTSYSSVVVPVTRVERIGAIWIAASPTERALAPASAERSPAQIAVWMGSLTTEFADLHANRVAHVSQLLGRWGMTVTDAIEVPREP